jgi:hypothetical protein
MNVNDRRASIARRVIAYLAEIPRLKQAEQPQQSGAKASTVPVANGRCRGAVARQEKTRRAQMRQMINS